MAKKTFTINSSGVTAGQQLDVSSTSVKLSGNLNGSEIFLEASDSDADYKTVSGGPVPQNAVTTARVAAGWWVRCRAVTGGVNPDATLVIE